MLNKIKEYYETAKRTALIAHENATKKWNHLFSVIELLPDDIPKYNLPTSKWHENKIVRQTLSSQNDEYSFYLIINDLKVEEAINIFENPLIYNITDSKENYFFNKFFQKEPNSTYPFIFHSNIYTEEGLSSILPKRYSDLYVWTQIDIERIVERKFKANEITKEMKAMSQLTNDWLDLIYSQNQSILVIYTLLHPIHILKLNISLSTNQ